MHPFDHGPGEDRSQSETLGVALLVGLAVIGAVAAVVTGLAVLDSDQERVGFEQAERSLSQFDSESSDVALGRSESARIDFGRPDTEGSMSVRPNEGWIRVNFTDLTGVRDPNTATVTNTTLGSVVYQKERQTIGYQGGGVFRSDGNRSVLVSRPEFHYRNGTLTIPIIRTEGTTATLDSVHVTPNGTEQFFPDASRNLTNKVDNTTVIVTVQSRYYEAWADYFRAYTPGLVTVNDTTQTARVQFIALPDSEGVGAGIIATSESGELALEGTGAYVDAYDSPNYDGGKPGNVRSVGNVTMTGNSTIDGDVEVGQSIDMDGDSLVTGDVNWTVSKEIDGTVEGNKTQIDGVPTVLPIDDLVIDRVNNLSRSNDNENASFVPNSGGGVDISDSETLGAGRYYMDHLTVDGGTLEINTTDGNVTIGVEDWISLPKGGEVNVVGNNTVRIFHNAKETTEENPTGEGTADVNFYLGKDATVSIPENRAPKLRIFAQQDLQGYIGGSSGQNATFNGLVYAPDGLVKDGDFFIKQAEIYGGIVAGTIRLGQYGQIHYDEELNDLRLPQPGRFARLEYMHVTVHRMNVVSD